MWQGGNVGWRDEYENDEDERKKDGIKGTGYGVGKEGTSTMEMWKR